MIRLAGLILILVALDVVPNVWPNPAAAQDATAPVLSERVVAYDIEASLDPEARSVTATQTLIWRNRGPNAVRELQFHMYLNGFRDSFSTFMRESGGQFRGVRNSEDDHGSITITELVVDPNPDGRPGSRKADLVDLTDRIVFIQPDDHNPFDESVFSLTLPFAVGPGSTVALHFNFVSVLPRVSARTGWERTASGNLFFLVAQWFPKIGVYEIPGQRYVPPDAREGLWNTHQFHANSEFYADFGTYRVSIDVPADYVVGATGELTFENVDAGRKRLVYEASDVHDFAWTASPDFREHITKWRDVSITTLMLPEHQHWFRRVIDAATIGLERSDQWIGPYPYKTLTIVDALGGAVGMEYPTLFTTWIEGYTPSWIRIPIEDTVIHEFVHQYFYGILANNEFEEAWLDEGFTTYMTARIMDDAYGPGSSAHFAGVNINTSDSYRLVYSRLDPGRGSIYAIPWEQTSGVYGRTAYYKSAVLLFTLERLIGEERMLQVLSEYYRRWRFDHPTTRDFIEIVEDVSGEDLAWFFDQYVYTSAVVDYRVERISNRPVTVDDSTVVFDGEVLVERAADGVFPQTVRVYYTDGSTRDFSWDGEEQWHVLSTTGPSRIRMAEIDPEDKVWLDVNRLDNRVSVVPDGDSAREMQLTAITVLEHLLYIATALF